MKLKKQISDFFSYDKYYRMDIKELDKIAEKRHIEKYENIIGNAWRKDKIIKNLIEQDNNSLFRKTLLISILALAVSFGNIIAIIIVTFFK